MVQQERYALLEISENADSDPEIPGVGSDSDAEDAGRTHGGVAKFAKPLAVLLLLGMAAGIYSVTKSPSGVAGAQPSSQNYDEAHENLLYEEGEDSTPSPGSSTVSGMLSIQSSDPGQFANDPAAQQAVTETIAAIAGVPVSTVKDVSMTTVNGEVQASFTITVPAGQADDVAAQISSSTPESDSAILSEKLDDAGLSATYPNSKVTAAEAAPTPGPTPAPTTDPCVTTTGNPCVTTSAPAPGPTPVNPCGTTPAPGMFKRIFR